MISSPETGDNLENLADDFADLRAQFYGFQDAADMKAEGERMERERLAELSEKMSKSEAPS